MCRYGRPSKPKKSPNLGQHFHHGEVAVDLGSRPLSGRNCVFFTTGCGCPRSIRSQLVALAKSQGEENDTFERRWPVGPETFDSRFEKPSQGSWRPAAGTLPIGPTRWGRAWRPWKCNHQWTLLQERGACRSGGFHRVPEYRCTCAGEPSSRSINGGPLACCRGNGRCSCQSAGHVWWGMHQEPTVMRTLQHRNIRNLLLKPFPRRPGKWRDGATKTLPLLGVA